MQTLVIFDIGDTPLRTRVSNLCKDAGGVRIQNSAFLGDLDEQQRETLCGRMERAVARHTTSEGPEDGARSLLIEVFPLCSSDFAKARALSRGGWGSVSPMEELPVVVL